MNNIKSFILLAVIAVFTSCIEVDPYMDSVTSSSLVTYTKNSLDYPIRVQCWFRPLNDNPFWCENELIPYSDPILIEPNGTAIVMDYVQPIGIKIFKSDSTLLYENFNISKNSFLNLPEGIIYCSQSESKALGQYSSKEVVSKDWLYDFDNCYFIYDKRYLADNVPWSLYPIFYNYYDCDDKDLISYYESTRRELYEEISTGYAAVRFFDCKKDAESFLP